MHKTKETPENRYSQVFLFWCTYAHIIFCGYYYSTICIMYQQQEMPLSQPRKLYVTDVQITAKNVQKGVEREKS